MRAARAPQVALCNAAQLLPAPLLRLIPDALDKPEDSGTDGDAGSGDEVLTKPSSGGTRAVKRSAGGADGGAGVPAELKDVA